MTQALRLCCVVPLLILLAGCESLGYYSQALRGQLALMRSGDSLELVISDAATSPRLRQQLELVRELREFAETELLLPAEDQYTRYVDLGRSFAVWNMFAAPALSLEPKTWCYPVLGCLAYRGYFSEAEAQAYADSLSAEGLDSYVGGVAAYSTLGWTSDPVLNTFVYRSEARLAELIFHELAHQLLFVSDDTVFNESFATAVAREGVRRWMRRHHDPMAYDAFRRRSMQREAFVGLVDSLREKLQHLYAGDEADGTKRRRKVQLIDELRLAYAELEQTWSGESPFREWVNAPMNNAKLNSVAAYNDLVPALQVLLAQSDNLDDFYRRCRELGELAVAERHDQLNRLAEANMTEKQ